MAFDPFRAILLAMKERLRARSRPLYTGAFVLAAIGATAYLIFQTAVTFWLGSLLTLTPALVWAVLADDDDPDPRSLAGGLSDGPWGAP